MSSKRCAEPFSLGRHGDRSKIGVPTWTVVVQGLDHQLSIPLSSTEFLQNSSEGLLLKSLALLFVVWAFSPGHGHISNSSEVAQSQQAGR